MRNIENNIKNCANCGAPVTSEVCPYCHCATGLNTWSADMEYPVIDCKEANISFWTIGFPMIFAVSFGFAGLISLFTFSFFDESGILFSSIFLIIGLTALVIAIIPLIRYAQIKVNGKEIDATVYGYINDNIMLNGIPAQCVKLLIQTGDGPKFIIYQLGNISQPYKVNSKIKLKVYQNKFMILKDNKYYF